MMDLSPLKTTSSWPHRSDRRAVAAHPRVKRPFA